MLAHSFRLIRWFLPAAVGIVLATNLSAAVVYSGLQNISISSTFDGIYLDFTDGDDAATVTQSTTTPGTWDVNLFFGGAGIWNSDTFQPVTVAGTTNAAVLKLSEGDTVSGASTFPPLSPGYSGSTGHMGAGAGQWVNGETTGYIGFRIHPGSFTVNAPATTIYGWMLVTLQDDGSAGTIHSWAWDTSGDPITVPEPGTTALFGLCALTILLRRRRS
jgi:hypothetical protein